MSLIIVCVLDLVFPAKIDVSRYERLNSTDSDKDDESNKRKLRSSNKQQDDSDSELLKDNQNIDEKKEL